MVIISVQGSSKTIFAAKKDIFAKRFCKGFGVREGELIHKQILVCYIAQRGKKFADKCIKGCKI